MLSFRLKKQNSKNKADTIFCTRFVANLRFPHEIQLTLSMYVSIMRKSERNAVFAMPFSTDEKGWTRMGS